MTADDVAELLDHLHAAYPSAKLDEQTPLIWLQHLIPIHRADAEVAVFQWIETERFMPTVAQLLAACRSVARAARESDAGAALPELDLGDRETATEVRLAFIRACRAALSVIGQGGGADAASAAFDDHAPAQYPRSAVLYRCRCGEGQGWVMDETGAVRPCEACRPELHERWAGGHLAMGHRCADCARLPVGAP